MRFGLVIPTLNAAFWLDRLFDALDRQTLKPEQIVVIDSSSTDNTSKSFTSFGAKVSVISRHDFDHGGTRWRGALMLPAVPYVMFLTQDARPATEDTFRHLLSAFSRDDVGVAYGRQLPRPEAGPIEAHARHFNYPDHSTLQDEHNLRAEGIKATFVSNSFSAYRVAALQEINGFPTSTIFGEDVIAALRLMRRGWKKAYVAEAQVFHSHEYSMKEDFTRNFDIGVFHSKDVSREGFDPKPSGEGARYVVSELNYLWRTKASLIPEALGRTSAKLIAYNLGRRYKALPRGLVRSLSMNKSYWAKEANPGK